MRASLLAENNMSGPRQLVCIVAFDGVTAMDVVGAAEVFQIADRFAAGGGLARYSVRLVSEHGGAITGWSGIKLDTDAWSDLAGREIDTIIVPGGGPPWDPPVPEAAVNWLRENAPRARRVCGVCTGTFLLAAAGLCEGRKVTTHWQSIELLKRNHGVEVDKADPIFLRDGPLWTSAGFSAGMDLALAMIEEDEGYAVAVELARTMVMFLKRPGQQPQLSSPLNAQSRDDPDFSALHAWISENIQASLPVERLAERVGMSPRTFERRYAARMGCTPARMVTELRIDAALRQMASGATSLKDIARRSGFANEQAFRRALLRLRNMSPQDALAAATTNQRWGRAAV